LIQRTHHKAYYYFIAVGIVFFLFILTTVKISYSSFTGIDQPLKLKFFNPVINCLKQKGIDTNFIKNIVLDNRTKFDDKYVKINVNGYLKKTDYAHNFTKNSVQKAKDFYLRNILTLKKAEIEYGVPSEIITAILWIETRCGEYLGSNHIVSVFLSTAMVNQPEYIQLNKENLINSFNGDETNLHELLIKLEQRTEKKYEWAINELIALSKMIKSSPVPILDLYGSWAGAFGISQFLPSSYNSWAIDGNNDSIINLYHTDDAIFSVANYLKINGWCDTQECKRNAIFHYNNSIDYVEAVLQLSRKIKS